VARTAGRTAYNRIVLLTRGIVRAVGLCAALAFGAGFAVSAAPRPPARPNVLVIVIDTLRPDALGWVAGRNATPALDALAREGRRFPQAVSPVPLTLPAHVSLFTGLVPRRHGVRDNGHVLSTQVPTLAEALKREGYATAAVVSGYPLRALFGLDRGFDHYDDALPVEGTAWRDRPAAATTQAALDWLRTRRGRPEPWLLFAHYYDPHDPYTPPERFKRPGPRGAYDGEVAAVDDAVGALRRGMAEAGLAKGLLTVFTADHGESLGEHGEDTHGFFIYDATTLVPLVMHWPGHVKPGASDAPARLVDVTPTILDLLDLRRFPGVDGVSLRAPLEGRALDLPPAYVETLQPWLGFGWAPLEAVRAGGFKLIEAPRPELYDLRRDPQESTNRLARQPGEVRRLRAALREVKARSSIASAGVADGEALESLRALGYVGGGATLTEPPAGLADPKDRVRLKDKLVAAENALQAGDAAAALRGFDAALREEPDNRFALLRSGIALARLRRWREAGARLERVVRADPTQAEARYALADALTAAGDDERASQQWMEVARLQPRRAAAWSNLGLVLMRQGDARGAERALARAVALEPRDALYAENLSEVRFARAQSEARAGRGDEARRLLALALAAQPELRRRALADPSLAPLVP
jgi:arylsulfatase A-like enzyme/Flp pilus assembly protein TadD